jgi:HEAT repeat protein
VQDASISDQALTDLADHPDWRVRTQASIVLLWRVDADLFETVWKARTYSGRRGRIVRFAEPALELPEATPALIERLLRTDEPTTVRVALVKQVLANGGADEHLVGLLGAVQDPGARLHMAAGLRFASQEEALLGISLALQDVDPAVRAEAATAAAMRADGAVLADALIDALEDPDVAPRAMAARALGWLGVKVAAESLTLMVTDESAEVRLHALRSLDRIDPGAALQLPGLDALTRDADPKVARVARRIAGAQ